jgi:hypothetical protein
MRGLMAVLFATALVAWTSVAVGGPRQVFAAAMSLCVWSLAGATYIQPKPMKLRAIRNILVTAAAVLTTIAMVGSLSGR